MQLSGFCALRCKNCNNVFTVDGSDIDIVETASDERSMGPEQFFYGALEIECPKCRSEIKFEYVASEYPIGMLNYSESNVEGADLTRGFEDINIYYDDDIYSFDEETELYLPESKAIIVNLNAGVLALIDRIILNPKILYDVSSRDFEELIAHVFHKSGFEVELTKQSRDGGRDIIALKSDLGIPVKFLIECKRYAKSKPVGVSLVRNLFGVQQQEGANKSILVTTSTFTREAKEFANAKHTTEWLMDLKDYEDVYNWVLRSKKS